MAPDSINALVGEITVNGRRYALTGEARAILPIADPYVAHHGALGSFALVYCERPQEMAARFELPPGRTWRNFDAFDLALNLVAA
jgi:phosphonoacetate hydrolase